MILFQWFLHECTLDAYVLNSKHLSSETFPNHATLLLTHATYAKSVSFYVIILLLIRPLHVLEYHDTQSRQTLQVQGHSPLLICTTFLWDNHVPFM